MGAITGSKDFTDPRKDVFPIPDAQERTQGIQDRVKPLRGLATSLQVSDQAAATR